MGKFSDLLTFIKLALKNNNKFFGGSSYFSFVTSDDNLDATVTSAESVNVPESSMSSTFFDKNNHAS